MAALGVIWEDGVWDTAIWDVNIWEQTGGGPTPPPTPTPVGTLSDQRGMASYIRIMKKRKRS